MDIRVRDKININSKLPQQVIQVILSKLHGVDLPYCRLVCKSWNDMILDHSFTSILKLSPKSFFFYEVNHRRERSLQSIEDWPNYLIMSCLDFDSNHSNGIEFLALFNFKRHWSEFRIVNSCNGLVCINGGNNDTHFWILNPLTNEYMKVKLSRQEIRSPHEFMSCSYGFGFGIKTKQYKLVRIGYSGDRFNHTLSWSLKIFTLGGSKGWEWFDLPLFEIDMYNSSDGVFLNGSLYWVGSDGDKKKIIARFDVDYDRFKIVSLPAVDSVDDWSVYIQVFNGRLCAILFDKRKQCREFEVWIMLGDEGREGSWIKVHVIKDMPKDWKIKYGLLQIIKVCENGEIICLVERRYLFSYNPKNGEIKIKYEKQGKCFCVYEFESPNYNSLEKIIAGIGHD